MTADPPRSTVMARNALAAVRMMTQRTAELLVIGDPGSNGWQHLERETACRVRLLGDSRGGLLALLLEVAGPRRFVQYLAELGDAALINTRILFHDADYPTDEDFLQSDLGYPMHIIHRELRELTEAFLDSEWPVILGGDSLMTDGIYALVEQAWKTQELARQFSVVDSSF